VIVLCFSVSNPASLKNISNKWLPEITHYRPDVPFVFVALKVDTREDEHVKEKLQRRQMQPISKEMGERAALLAGAVAYFETSSVTGEGVKELSKYLYALAKLDYDETFREMTQKKCSAQ
jgi:GTPase SAR1 family protein